MTIWDLLGFFLDPDETIKSLERRWEVERIRTEQLLVWSRTREDARWDALLRYYEQRALLDFLTEKQKELIEKRTENAIKIIRELKRSF